MSKSSPSPPDYTGAAEATGKSSQAVNTQQTWANRPNVSTPWGSQTWSSSQATDPSTGQPVTSWNSNISLSPDQQKALDSQQAIQQGRSNAAGTLLDQATGAFQQPFDWGSLPARADNVSAPTLSDSPIPQAGQFQSQIDPTGHQLQTVDPFSFGDITRQIKPTTSTIQTGFGDPNAMRQVAQDAVWNLQKPMLEEHRSDTENQLSNMGLARGSEAWNREERNLGDTEERARLAAIEAGRSEANTQFGQNLQAAQFNNNAQGQEWGQNATQAGFGNQAQGQAYTQGVGAAGLNNQVQGQEFGQNTTQATFGNNVTQQEYQDAMESAKMGDTRKLQDLQSRITAGNFNNANRSQALIEAMQRRSQPLNELNALLTGQQVQNPTMPNVPIAGRAAPVDYTTAANDQYQAAIGNANFSQAGLNQLLQLGGTLGSAAMFAFSDRRLKRRIRTVGLLSTGVRVVHYEYIGVPGSFVGVIAQELQRVQPEAVAEHSSGYLMVDYSKVRL